MQRINRFSAIIFLIGLLLSAAVAAQEVSPYLVRDVEAAANGKNASDARAKAMQLVEKAAFAKLLEQIGQDVTLAESAKPEQISAAIEGFEIVSEKMGGKKYSLKTHITFNPDETQQLIQQAALARQQPAEVAAMAESSVAAVPSAPSAMVIIVPILRDYGSAVLWEESNGWREFWNRRTVKAGEVKTALPLGDIGDMAAVDVAKISQLDAAALKYLAGRYRSNTIIIADASRRFMPDGIKMDVILQPVFVDVSGVQTLAQNNFSLQGAATEAELFTRAVDEAMMRLSASQTDSAVVEPVPSGALQQMKLIIPLGHIAEWVRIRKMLEDTPYVTDVRMLAISPSQADVMIRFNCSVQQMVVALSQAGHGLQQQDDYWILRPGMGEVR